MIDMLENSFAFNKNFLNILKIIWNDNINDKLKKLSIVMSDVDFFIVNCILQILYFDKRISHLSKSKNN